MSEADCQRTITIYWYYGITTTYYCYFTLVQEFLTRGHKKQEHVFFGQKKMWQHDTLMTLLIVRKARRVVLPKNNIILSRTWHSFLSLPFSGTTSKLCVASVNLDDDVSCVLSCNEITTTPDSLFRRHHARCKVCWRISYWTNWYFLTQLDVI